MKAIIATPTCPLTEKPEATRTIVDEVLFGTVVEVTKQYDSSFWRVRTPYGYEGYAVTTRLIAEEDMVAWWEGLPKRVVLYKNFCDVLMEPDFRSWTRVVLPMGSVIAVGENVLDGWQGVLLPTGQEGYSRASWLDTWYTSPIDLPEDQLRDRLARTALRYLGTQYHWGGKSPLGIDCSGLVSMAYLLNGIAIYRDSIIMDGFPIHEIDPANMKKGDLLYFPGHVAMYLGDQRFIHATGREGSDGVVINSLDPQAPDYRSDLATSLSAVGSLF